MKKNYFSLMEMIVSLGLTGILISMGAQFFIKSMTISRHSIQQAQNNQDIDIIKKHWRAFLKRNPGEISIEKKQFFIKKDFVKLDGNTLIFKDQRGELKDILPKDSTLNFKIEKNQNKQILAVLNIQLKVKRNTVNFRIVGLANNGVKQ